MNTNARIKLMRKLSLTNVIRLQLDTRHLIMERTTKRRDSVTRLITISNNVKRRDNTLNAFETNSANIMRDTLYSNTNKIFRFSRTDLSRDNSSTMVQITYKSIKSHSQYEQDNRVPRLTRRLNTFTLNSKAIRIRYIILISMALKNDARRLNVVNNANSLNTPRRLMKSTNILVTTPINKSRLSMLSNRVEKGHVTTTSTRRVMVSINTIQSRPLTTRINVFTTRRNKTTLSTLTQSKGTRSLNLRKTKVNLAISNRILRSKIFPIRDTSINTSIKSIRVTRRRANSKSFLRNLRRSTMLTTTTNRILSNSILRLERVVAVAARVMRRNNIGSNISSKFSLKITRVSILRDTTTLYINLRTRNMIRDKTIRNVIIYRRILSTTTRLTTTNSTTITIYRNIITSSRILNQVANFTRLATVTITTNLSNSTIITNIRRTILGRSMITIFKIATIIIMTINISNSTTNNRINTRSKIRLPRKEINSNSTLSRGINALSKLMRIKARVITFTRSTLLYKNTIINRLTRRLSIIIAKLNSNTIQISNTKPIPPIILIDLAIRNTLTNRDSILLLVNMSRQTPIMRLKTFMINRRRQMINQNSIPNRTRSNILTFRVRISITLRNSNTSIVRAKKSSSHTTTINTNLISNTLSNYNIRLAIIKSNTMILGVSHMNERCKIEGINRSLFYRIPKRIIKINDDEDSPTRTVLIYNYYVERTKGRRYNENHANENRGLATDSFFRSAVLLALHTN